ncbi:MAG: fused MFS/spermidine synthase [Chloroflexota bacterium]
MRRYLLFTVFASGMTTLAAELAAGRLIGNVYGTSNLVWASIIGLILIYLTFGYSLGGRWADRYPTPFAMYRILAWGAFTLGIVPYISTPVLRAAATAFEGFDFAVMGGAFVGVLVLFSVPITLLGTISPFAIRLSMDDTAHAGRTSGQIYAVSTLGSFIGTFLPVLVLIPTIGTTRTFLVFSLFLLFIAIAGMALNGERRQAIVHLWMVLALAVVAALGAGQKLKNSEGQVYETESAYNYIQVIQQDGYTMLRLNDGNGIHSIYHADKLYYGGPWELFLVGPYFYPDMNPADVGRIGIVGLAAGTAARQATAVYGPIPIDGWEIDPVIVEAGREYFGMTMPNLNVFVEDGRYGLEHSPHQYDILAVDAYRPPYIPPHMTTLEFFQMAASHLTPRGVLAINVGRAPNDRSLINGLATTLAAVFPSVHVVDIPGTLNSLVYATVQPTSPQAFADNFMRLANDPSVHPLLTQTLAVAYSNLQPGYEIAMVFTDDRAPIEWLTNNLVINFILHGDVDSLQ